MSTKLQAEPARYKDLVGHKVKRRWLEWVGPFCRNLPGLMDAVTARNKEIWAVSPHNVEDDCSPEHASLPAFYVRYAGGEFVKIERFGFVRWAFVSNRWVGVPDYDKPSRHLEVEDSLWKADDEQAMLKTWRNYTLDGDELDSVLSLDV